MATDYSGTTVPTSPGASPASSPSGSSGGHTSGQARRATALITPRFRCTEGVCHPAMNRRLADGFGSDRMTRHSGRGSSRPGTSMLTDSASNLSTRTLIPGQAHSKSTSAAPFHSECIASATSTCCICWDTKPGAWKKLPCGHMMHADCVTSWGKQSMATGGLPTCLLCRTEFSVCGPHKFTTCCCLCVRTRGLPCAVTISNKENTPGRLLRRWFSARGPNHIDAA